MNGYVELYRSNGRIWSRCNYINEKEIGYEEVNLELVAAIGEPGTMFIFHII